MKKLTALFAFAFFLVFVGWAITPVQADPPRPSHKHGDGGATGVVYCAELISNDPTGAGRAFQWEGCVPVIPNEKETDLRFPVEPVVRPHGEEQGSGTDWYRVFDDCDVFDILLDDGTVVHEDTLDVLKLPVLPITVATSAGRGGGVRVAFIGIVYGDPKVDVVVQLIGDCFNDSPTPIPCNADFFPEPGETSDFTLLQALLQGHTVEKPKGHYNKHRDRLDLVSPSKLTITAIQCLEGESLQGSPPVCST